ncbi:MAG: DUF1579 domain-containing protein [Phycisphaeraceae bacterium]|nr:DUF1579 domain-containing protein [Phycisphaeraceae bacterium]
MNESAQSECPMTIKPRAEHQWLGRMAGEWSFESECFMGPDQPPFKSGGEESVRLLGELWVVGESTVSTPDGGTAGNIIALGFDPARGRFVGTFITSCMAHLWVYDGELDLSGRILTLHAEGPSMDPASEGKLVSYRDVVELVDERCRRLTSHVRGEDGKWFQFMTATYRRKA